MRLTPHFTMEELLRTNHPELQEEPTQEQLLNATVLSAAILEPIRKAWEGPIRVNSWLRSPAVNEKVGGWDTSLHLTGQAADIQAYVGSRVLLWRVIRHLVNFGLPLTTGIVYTHKSHIHVSYAWRNKLGDPALYLARPGELVPWRDTFENEVV